MIITTLRQLLVVGLYTLPGFAYNISLPPNCTYSPENRACWRDGYNILSDYNVAGVVPPGKLVEYDITLSQQIVSPDGFERLGMVINGQYPGPAIVADWGDTLRITVRNNFTENLNGTSIHWHGIRQFETNWLDGVPGVTQCPSKPGEAQVYEFRAMQYGNSWYHGHFSLQYSNGLYGPLVINGPSSANYDVDLGSWLLSDWYHNDVFGLDWVGRVTFLAALPESTVLNGKGFFDCSLTNSTRCKGDGAYYEVLLQEGTTYRIGITNTGTLLTYQFWIDGHNFTVVQADFVPIVPFVTDVINVGIGQRYQIIIEANPDFEHGPNFWIHAQYCNEADLLDNKVGIVRYDASNTSEPWTPPLSEQHRDYGCNDPDPSTLVPIVKQNVGNRVNGLEPEDYLKIAEIGNPNSTDPNQRVHYWYLKDTPMYLNWSDPTVRKMTLDSEPEFPADTVPIYLDFETDEWVYFVITANYSLNGTNPKTEIELTQSVHPIHLHGHDFAILAQGQGMFNESIVPNLINPARRDVVDIGIGGWAWIAFQINNPGAWLMHCHIAFHASDGLALQFIEQSSKLKGLMEKANVLGEFSDRCDSWTKYYNTKDIPANATQADSGI